MRGRLAKRATDAWAWADKKKEIRRDPALERITLHECRHTYASFLMAAGYTLKEIMEYMATRTRRWCSTTRSCCPSRTTQIPPNGSTPTSLRAAG